jgi:hypothetical protein
MDKNPQMVGQSPDDANPSISQEDRIETQRARRIPMSVPQARMATPAIPGYHLHWFNDTPGRIIQAQNAGYTFVNMEETHVNSRDVAGSSEDFGSSDMGTRISTVVGESADGGAQRAYLMKIPEEFFQEDQKALESRNAAIDQAMRAGKQNPTNPGDDAQRYVKTSSVRQSFNRSS